MRRLNWFSPLVSVTDITRWFLWRRAVPGIGARDLTSDFEAIYAYMKEKPGVLFWKGEEILDWYRGMSVKSNGLLH